MRSLLSKFRGKSRDRGVLNSPASHSESKGDSELVLSGGETQDPAVIHARLGLQLVPVPAVEPLDGRPSYNIDVVAVHGLGGDPYDTWTSTPERDGGKPTFWLADLLPQELPGARVFTFGYASRPVFTRSVASIRDYSKQLLQSLVDHTEPHARRPIIFLCHSLGGIVVKQAIISANENDRFFEISRTAKGVIFMGTPHRGSDIAAALIPLAAVLNLGLRASGGGRIFGSIRKDLIKLLSRDSNALGDITESFVQRVKVLKITSFYETEFPPGLSQLIVKKSSALLGIPNEEDIPLNAHHMDMCRFASSEDPNFRLVSHALVRTARSISGQVDLDSNPAQSLRSLTDSKRRYVSHFEETFRVNVGDRVEGTCSWSLSSHQYQSWQNDQNATVLWITGDAGCGKTTLASFLVDNLQTQESYEYKEKKGKPIVSCFFCSKDIRSQRDARSVLRGLILQILTSRQSLIAEVRSKFGSFKREFDQSFESLWKIFTFSLEAVRCDRLYVVIEALDECQTESREKLLSNISSILKSWNESVSPSLKQLKFLITAQPQIMTSWRAITGSSAQYHLKIEDRPQGMVQDVLSFINKNVDELVSCKRCTVSFANDLRKSLSKLAENSFLWVSLVLDHIKATIELSILDLPRIFSQIPKDLGDAYSSYLPSVAPHNVSIVRRYVGLLVASSRPLTLDEVGTLANLRRDNGRTLSESVSASVTKTSVELIFGPLVRLSHTHVHFIHLTVKEFLVGLSADEKHPLHETHGIDLNSAHLALATCCMRYLLLDDMSIDHFDSQGPGVETSPTTDSSMNSPVDLVPMADVLSIHDISFLKDVEALHQEACIHLRFAYKAYDYAALNWDHHYALCEHLVSDALLAETSALFDTGSMPFSNWYNYIAQQSNTSMPRLESLNRVLTAALFNHSRTLQALIRASPRLPDKNYQIALFWAAAKGHATAVRTLIEHGVNPDVVENGQTPLGIGVQGGHRDVCTALLKASVVDPNFTDAAGRPPLVIASANNQHEILKLLLDHEEIEVNTTDSLGRTAFLEASGSASVECLKILIADGRSDIAHVDCKARSSLSLAASTDSKIAIKCLLKIPSLDLYSSDSSGRNAISYAAAHGNTTIVRQLWIAKLQASEKDTNGRNATSWAANSSAATIEDSSGNSALKFLVRKFPESVNAKDRDGWTPLAWAMDPPGYLNAVRVLIEDGEADVNQRDETGGRPPLSWAANEGFDNVVKYLLQVRNIDKNLEDFEGRTAISYAAGSGRLNVVRALLEDRDVQPTLPDSSGRTALDWAKLNHHDTVVQELLSYESGAMSNDGPRSSP